MKLRANMRLRFFMLTVSALSLSACGESDLIDQQERELAMARAAVASALPDVDPADSAFDLSNYEMVFSDEFQSDTLDSDKWNTALTWGPDLIIHNQLQYYVDSQNLPEFSFSPFTFDGEVLSIRATETPNNIRSDANEQAWLSGVLTTAGKFDFTYGYVEASIDVPEGRGMWPAFWMLSTSFDQLRPELYIMEANGAFPNSIFHNYNYNDENGNLLSPGQWEVASSEYSEGFQKVGLAWSPGELLFYINDMPQYRIVGDSVSAQDMYLILNLAVGGIWPGAPDGTTPAPAEMLIDYVRVYQLSD